MRSRSRSRGEMTKLDTLSAICFFPFRWKSTEAVITSIRIINTWQRHHSTQHGTMTWQTQVQWAPQPMSVPLLVLSSSQRGETTLTDWLVRGCQNRIKSIWTVRLCCSPYCRHSPSQTNRRLIDASINTVGPPRVRHWGKENHTVSMHQGDGPYRLFVWPIDGNH